MRQGDKLQSASMQRANVSQPRVCFPHGIMPGIAVAVLLAAQFFFADVLHAQQASQPAAAPAPVVHSKKSSHAHAKAAAAQPAPPPVQPSVTPPAPPPPDWPANDQPSEASVTWDSRGLSVVAANSSLVQIMKAVSADTGASLDGLSKDQRVFGIYGPGPARDVITQLLDGSGYNVLMVGDMGQGTPRQIILTPQTPGSPQPAGARNPQPSPSEEETEAEPEPPPQPEPPTPASASGAGAAAPAVPMRTQEQLIEDLRNRQMQGAQQQPQPNQ
jgi:hypothetical protein